MAPKRPYRVFIGHATADKDSAKTICDKIAEIRGTSTFRDDRDIRGGASIPASIRAAIRRSDQFLVLLTPASITRTWVILEIGIAFGLGKLIVPIYYNVAVDAISLLAHTRAYQLDDLESYMYDLRKRVRRRKR